MSEIWKESFELVQPSASALLHLIVPGPGTPGGDLVSEWSEEPLESLCDGNYAVLSFREPAADAPARGLIRTAAADTNASSAGRADLGGGAYTHSPSSSDGRTNGPSSVPCSPPVSASAMEGASDSEILGLDGENSASASAVGNANAAIKHGRGLQGLSNLGELRA